MAQSAAGFRPAAAGAAERGQPVAGPAAELAGQLRACRATGYDNEIAVLSPVGPTGKLTTLYQPDGGRVRRRRGPALRRRPDALLHARHATAAGRSSRSSADGTGLRQVTPGDEPDVDNYDACYLPDGRIIFASTALLPRRALRRRRRPRGQPLPHGRRRQRTSASSASTRTTTGARRCCNDGRVLYTRWEYTDTPHYFTPHPVPHEPRRHGPDGVLRQQLLLAELDLLRPADPRPSDASSSAIVGGHHGVPRMGELVLFDPAKGRHEADGVVQRIPGYGKQGRADHRATSWSTAVLAEVPPSLSAQRQVLPRRLPSRRRESLWGIYLVDVFDNMLLLQGGAGLRAARADPAAQDARAAGHPRPGRPRAARTPRSTWPTSTPAPGLTGVPRGTVKTLRLFELPLRLSGHGRATSTSASTARGTSSASSAPCRSRRTARPCFRVPANTPDRRPAAGRRGQGPAAHAELVHGHAGRDASRASAATSGRTRPRPTSGRWPPAGASEITPGTARARVQLRGPAAALTATTAGGSPTTIETCTGKT